MSDNNQLIMKNEDHLEFDNLANVYEDKQIKLTHEQFIIKGQYLIWDLKINVDKIVKCAIEKNVQNLSLFGLSLNLVIWSPDAQRFCNPIKIRNCQIKLSNNMFNVGFTVENQEEFRFKVHNNLGIYIDE